MVKTLVRAFSLLVALYYTPEAIFFKTWYLSTKLHCSSNAQYSDLAKDVQNYYRFSIPGNFAGFVSFYKFQMWQPVDNRSQFPRC